MELITPGFGLIFWQTIIFLLLFLILKKFAWKPILDSLKIREDSIEEALSSAEKARSEMAQLKADNEKLLDEARAERNKILKDATAVANNIKEEAKAESIKISDKMLEDATAVIRNEKQSALTEVKDLVASLSINIAEKILRKNLSDDKEQKALMKEFIKDIKLN